MTLRRLLPLLSAPWITLATPGALRAPAQLTRAQVSSLATALGADGVTWTEFAADTLRFSGVGQRLMLGGQRANSIRNPRGEGSTAGVIGSGGVAPTNWGLTAVSGIAWEIIGTGTENGINYVRVRLSGTAVGTTPVRSNFEQPGAIVASPGQVWTNSHFVRLVSGAQNGMSWQQEVREYAGGVAGTLTSGAAVTLTTTWQRATATRTLIDAGTTAQWPTVRVSLVNAAIYNLVMDIGWPQAELGAFASTPILPSIGSPAASTRGADLVSAPLSALGIKPGGPFTIVGLNLLGQPTPTGARQVICQVDDGSDSNVIGLSQLLGQGTYLRRVTAGAQVEGASTGNMDPTATLARWGIKADGAGNAAGIVYAAAGGSPTLRAVTGAPVSGLTTLRWGNNAANTGPAFGEGGYLQILPGALPDAAFIAAVQRVPLA